MELKITDIVTAAGKIINESGINSLSIDELAGEMKIDHSFLDPYIKNDDDILMLLLHSLEDEIKLLISDNGTVYKSPEEDLQILFKNMHELLKLKPYYLSVIFCVELKEKNTVLQKALLRIKLYVKTYLLEVINHGKRETVFKTRQTSRSLVNNILGSFRSFMNEQRLIALMVKDLENLKAIKD
jgi:hypothetical protein